MVAIIDTTTLMKLMNVVDGLTFVRVWNRTSAPEVLCRADKVDRIGLMLLCLNRHEILMMTVLMKLIMPPPGEIGCVLQRFQLLVEVPPLEFRRLIIIPAEEECRIHTFWKKKRTYTT